MTYNPWLDAAERYAAVHIEWHPLGGPHAAWSPEHDIILVDESISRAQRRCALSHEIAHMDVGDKPTAMCWFAMRQENAADRLAARRLVDVHDVAAALRYCNHPRELAEALDVTLEVLALRGTMWHPAERAILQRVLDRCEAVA